MQFEGNAVRAVACAGEEPPAVPAGEVSLSALSRVMADRGECTSRGDSGLFPDAWFPSPGSGLTPEVRAALATCWRCPAQVECLLWSLLAHEGAGIWGGAVPEVRKRLRRRARRSQKPLLDVALGFIAAEEHATDTASVTPEVAA